MIRYINGEKYSCWGIGVKQRRKYIIDQLKKKNLPIHSKRLFEIVKGMSYSTFARDIRTMAKANVIDVAVCKGGKNGCFTVIESIRGEK